MPYNFEIEDHEFECPKIIEVNNEDNDYNEHPYVELAFCESFGKGDIKQKGNGCKYKNSCPNYQKKKRGE